MMKQILVGAALLGLAACGNTASKVELPPEAASATRAAVTQGELVGFVAANGSHVWRGVPFASDTSGKNRWRAPRPAPNWEGVREAINFAPVCPQIATPFTPIESFTNGQLEGSEDCLAMDIYAPADAKGKSLPVMLWIHGGSNVSGASQLYVGENLANNENVIVMSVQYRLGPLGWFSHPDLKETAATPEDATANFGTLDLIAALKWAKDNAASFGGNPDNVTIFGESAGGHNVATLLASPLAEGLFHRAIIQSGGFDSITIEEAQGKTGEQPNPSLEVTKRLGGSENFHTASLQEVFEAYELDEGGFMDLPRIVQDGVVLPEGTLRNAFSSMETFNAVPVMSGINKDEMKLFYLFDERLTKAKFGKFYVARDQDFYDAASEYSSRIWRVRSVDMPLTMMGEAGHEDVYAYRFDWDEGGKILWMDLSKMLGAAHSLEIPFVLNRFKLLGDADGIMFKKKTLATRDVLSRSMGAYWAAFARNGQPNNADLPNWPAYGSSSSVMYFDSTNDRGIRAEDGADSFAKITADLKSDTRLDSAQRCEIADGLKQWIPTLETALKMIEACES
ncbi:MAG: carboxylesterase family protein [Hellea sp.]